MPTIMPIRELKDTAKISAIVRETEEPVFITKNGYSEMVIMSPEVYDREKFYQKIFEKLIASEHAVARGELLEAHTAIAEIRKSHAL